MIPRAFSSFFLSRLFGGKLDAGGGDDAVHFLSRLFGGKRLAAACK